MSETRVETVEHRRFEITRGQMRATIYTERGDMVYVSGPGGHASMLVEPDAIPDLIAVLRVAQDVWTRYAKPARNGAG